jgi:hypothetical protein
MRSIASTARTAATFNQTAQLFDSVPGARKWLHGLLKRLYAYKVDRVTGDVLAVIAQPRAGTRRAMASTVISSSATSTRSGSG